MIELKKEEIKNDLKYFLYFIFIFSITLPLGFFFFKYAILTNMKENIKTQTKDSVLKELNKFSVLMIYTNQTQFLNYLKVIYGNKIIVFENVSSIKKPIFTCLIKDFKTPKNDEVCKNYINFVNIKTFGCYEIVKSNEEMRKLTEEIYGKNSVERMYLDYLNYVCIVKLTKDEKEVLGVDKIPIFFKEIRMNNKKTILLYY